MKTLALFLVSALNSAVDLVISGAYVLFLTLELALLILTELHEMSKDMEVKDVY